MVDLLILTSAFNLLIFSFKLSFSEDNLLYLILQLYISVFFNSNNEFFLDKQKCLNSLKSLGELTDDNKREEIFKSFEGDLSSKEKERIKMYK